jgi:hypothetical protein
VVPEEDPGHPDAKDRQEERDLAVEDAVGGEDAVVDRIVNEGNRERDPGARQHERWQLGALVGGAMTHGGFPAVERWMDKQRPGPAPDGRP